VFAGLLNRGLRGSLVLISLLFLISLITCYLSPGGLEETHYPNLFYNYFTQKIDHKLLINLFNFLFIGVGLTLVSLISVNQEIVDKLNYFPVFLFLLISVVSADPNQITPQIFTNAFVLYAVYKLLDIYRKENVLSQIFEASFWLSVSAFITISSIISFPLFFISLLILRTFHWREWMIALLGFFIPFFIYECMAYLTNFNQWYLVDAVELYFSSMKTPLFSEYFLPFSLTLVILLVISVFYNFMYGFGNTVKKQRTKSIILWFIFLCSFGFFSEGANSSSILLTYAFPSSFFIGDYLYNLKQLKIANTLLSILILCGLVIILGQFGWI
jgi:hypothetical protein